MRGNLWSAEAPGEDRPVDLVVYRSRLIGADPDLVVWGGGNTSVKTDEVDFRGRPRRVLRIKGSGTDLKTIDASGFPGVYLDDLLPLLEREAMTDEEMVAYLEHCAVEPSGRRPSIETLLHGFLPARHVDHVHADAIVALTNSENGLAVVREALGSFIAAVPYQRPGFALAKAVYKAAKGHDAVVLMNHGLVTWGETAEESYRATIDLAELAQLYLERQSTRRRGFAPTFRPHGPVPTSLPLETLLLRVRGRLGGGVLRIDSSDSVRELADRWDIDAIANPGPATADHVLRIRTWTCVLDGDDPEARIDAYEERYRAFFERHAEPGLAMLSPLPKVFLVPGVGMITAGRDAQDALATADVAFHTLRVAAWGIDAHDSYRALSDEDLFHVDYWPLELYKLTLAPPPAECEGKVVVVTGAASGIGRAVARHLARLRAQLVLLDLDGEGLATTARQVAEAGGPAALCVTLDLTDEDAVRDAVGQAVRTFGGIDGLVSNAGIPAAGFLTDLSAEAWRRSMDVNATSHFLVTREVLAVMRTQGLGGSIVYVASKNAFGPGAGFGAYSAAKAAQVQLMRITALEGGKDQIRANAVNPDAVFEDSRLWSDDVRRERAAAHGVPVEDLEAFYAKRNLLGTTISGDDVAQAVAFLLSEKSRTTTGAVIAVDGGVAAAFPR
jgi:rhamnulose-1-phosphate aldolase/alcohol dehydrogenase